MSGRPLSPSLSDNTGPQSAHAWLFATALQALLTCGLLLIARFGVGKMWAPYAHVIALLGIVTTWSLALRTIRARLIELFSFWSGASVKLLQRASQSGRLFLSASRAPACDAYVKAAARRLRIIAAGLTIPFFALPVLWTFLSAYLSLCPAQKGAEYWLPVAMGMLLASLIVAGYFHWSIVPLPVAVPARAAARLPYRRRIR
jgi:hypothetical protein